METKDWMVLDIVGVGRDGKYDRETPPIAFDGAILHDSRQDAQLAAESRIEAASKKSAHEMGEVRSYRVTVGRCDSEGYTIDETEHVSLIKVWWDSSDSMEISQGRVG